MNKKVNNVTIKDNRVIKSRNDRVLELYDYFDTVSFDNYPKIINYDEENIESEFIDKTKYHEITKGVEFIKTVASLHNKTILNKDVSKNKYKTIYDKIYGNIEYLKELYESIISNIEEHEFMSPSEYLLARNYTVIDSSLNYASKSLKTWFNMVSNKSRERVCIVHNNLSLDHFIKGDKNYLLSFDNYLVDTPILDLYTFYKKEGYSLDFSYLLDEYEKINKLLDEEILLLNILISIPPKIEFINDELEDCINIQNIINYICSGINITNKNK